MYYFMVLDCSREAEAYFNKNIPKINSKWEIMSKEAKDYNAVEWTHFSYEDEG